jgi:DNA-binding NtrC family response regulator
MAKVLLVDDELTMVQMVAEMLRADGHEVFPCGNGPDALAAMETHQPELVVTDLYLDKNNAHGLDVLRKARSLNPPAVVIVITGFGSIETAVEAMKQGAYDYVEKPFKLDALRLCIQRALSYNETISENAYLKRQLRKKYQFSQIIGTSSKMQEVFNMIERVADTDCTVLILGESGTGKELVARALHFNSHRQFAPFIPINCSALPENLLESELFGHCKGSFTGAIQDKKGLFQEADGGTIFLDEIGSMSHVLQSRLLRVLQDREVRRVGENTANPVNVRVLAATNEPLEKNVKAGTFREDLYYRLNVIAIQMPPLRDRLDDVPLLVAHFLGSKLHRRTGQLFGITRQAMSALCEHRWPGNVRELENALERATTLAGTNVVQFVDLPPALHQYGGSISGEAAKEAHPLPEVPTASPYALTADGAKTNGHHGNGHEPAIGTPLKTYIRQQELTYLNRTLAYTEGDKEKAALLLGISTATLYRKLAEDSD